MLGWRFPMRILRSWHALGCAAALLLVAAGPRPVSGQLLGPEFRVNSYTTSHQQFPAVEADAAGNFVVVWASQGQEDPDFAGVFGQRYDAAGAPVGGEFQVNTFTTQIQSEPAVAMDDSGNFIVVWESNGQDGSLFGIFGQRFNPSGVPQGAEFPVNTFTTGMQNTPAVAVDGSGDFVVVWQSYGQDGNMSHYSVFGRRFNSSGTPASGEFQVNTFTTGPQRDPSVAMNAAGDFVIAWQSYLQDGAFYSIVGRRYSAAGTPQGGEFLVNSVTTNNQVVPAVAADGVGNFVVVWEDKAADGSGYGVFGQRYDLGGATLGGQFLVNSRTTFDQRNPAIAANDAGEFVVTWHSYEQDGSLDGVFGQRYSPAGGKAAGEFQLNTYTTERQMLSTVAADEEGRFVVAWRSWLQDGSTYGVYGRRVAALVFADGFESSDVCGWTSAVGSGDVCP